MRWNLPPRPPFSISLPGSRHLRLGARPLIMGVLNITPDSFADAGHVVADGAPDVARALALAGAMEAAGADIIDIGGESTRPGAAAVSADEEGARVVPVVAAVARQAAIPISVDTYKAEVAGRALAAGAAIVNDVSGLLYDPALAGVVAANGAGLILMHNRGRPRTMYEQAQYQDLIADVGSELEAAIARAEAAGVSREQIVVDPGIGFAKRPEHSYGVLARVSELAARLDRPVLIGASRKSFLTAATGDRAPVDRDWATAAAVAAAVLAGAHIVRVHAVPEMIQAVRVAEAIRQAAMHASTVAH